MMQIGSPTPTLPTLRTLPPPPPISSLHPMHGVSFKISYLLTSFYYEVLYISSILAGGHTGVVTFLV